LVISTTTLDLYRLYTRGLSRGSLPRTKALVFIRPKTEGLGLSRKHPELSFVLKMPSALISY